MELTAYTQNDRFAARFCQTVPGCGAGVTPAHLFVMPHAAQPRRRVQLLKPDRDTLPQPDAVSAAQALADFLQQDAPVLCLTGPAGCGKSTLAGWLCHGLQAGEGNALALTGGRALWVLDAANLPDPEALGQQATGGIWWLDGCGPDVDWSGWAAAAARAGAKLILAGRQIKAPAGAVPLALSPFDDDQRRAWVEHYTARCGQPLHEGLAHAMAQAQQLPNPRMTGFYYLPGGLLRLAQVGGDGSLCADDWSLFARALTPDDAPEACSSAVYQLCNALALEQFTTGAVPSAQRVQALAAESLAGDTDLPALCPGLTQGRFDTDEIYGFYLARALADRLDEAALSPDSDALGGLLCRLLVWAPLPPAALYFLYRRACAFAAASRPDFTAFARQGDRIGQVLSRLGGCLTDPALTPALAGTNPVARLRCLLANTVALYRVSAEPCLPAGETIPWLGSAPRCSVLPELFDGIFRKDTLSPLLGFGLGSRGDFSGASLPDLNLNLASFIGARFAGADLSGTVMTDAALAQADFTGAKLYGANLTDSVLADAVLAGADLRMGNLRGINFLRADLTGARMWSCDLDGSFLVYANLTGADLTDADCKNTHFEGARLVNTGLDGVHMAGISLLCADLTGARLRGADLRNANLGEANLTGADLTGADLSGASLAGANLTGATLTDATLDGCDLTGAIMPE